MQEFLSLIFGKRYHKLELSQNTIFYRKGGDLCYAKYNNAAVIEMMVNIMPQMAAEIAKPLSSIDKVNIYGGGGKSVKITPEPIKKAPETVDTTEKTAPEPTE